MDIQQAYTVTCDLLKEYRLYEKGWRFQLGRGVNTLGTCVHRRRLIRISRNHILRGNDKEVTDTIKHEIAHALAGPGHGHGKVWQEWAKTLGTGTATRKRVSYDTPRKYEMVCGNCDKVVQYRNNRMNPERLRRRYCRTCGEDASLTKLYLRFSEQYMSQKSV